MSSKEHCHGCGKLWSEESPECVFNYHKSSNEIKPSVIDQLSTIFETLDGLIEYESHVSPNDKTDYIAYLDISNLVWKQLQKVKGSSNEQ